MAKENEGTLQFMFNSALTKVSEKTGKFDEEEFRKQILPLRGEIMQIDGATGCTIGRYGVRVQYFTPAIPDLDEVKKRIVEIFEGAASSKAIGHDFFPLRGEKEVKVTFKG